MSTGKNHEDELQATYREADEVYQARKREYAEGRSSSSIVAEAARRRDEALNAIDAADGGADQ